MERDFEKELDELKNEVKRLGELLDGKAAAGKPQDGAERVGHIQRIPNMHPDPRLSSLMGDLESKSGARGTGGAITYLGVFASGGRQSSWIRNGVETDGLLALIENGTAERVLAHGNPREALWNLNLPDCEEDEVQGVVEATMAHAPYIDTYDKLERSENHGAYWLVPEKFAEGSDLYWLWRNYATITAFDWNWTKPNRCGFILQD